MSVSPRAIKVSLMIGLLGTAIGSALCIAAWTLHIGGFVRAGSNLFYILALPGWVPLYAAGLGGIRDHPLGIVAANAVAWGAWIMLILGALSVRSRVIGARSRGSAEKAGIDPSRRAFLCNAVAGAGAVGAVASPTYATLVEPWSIKVRRYRVPIRGLPASLDGLTLAQFSDPHLGPRIPASFVRHAVDLVVSLNPDLVLLTGDYIHDGTREIEEAARLCRPLVEHAKIGAVGVLGNHDWWGDGPEMSAALAAQGVRMIDNGRLWIDARTRAISTESPSGESLAIVGLGDLTEDIIDPDQAFAGVDTSTPRIVLAHQPDTAEMNRLKGPGSPRIDLMCSGHTHGGQVRIPFIGTPLVPSNYGSKYAGGLVKGPAFPVCVSRGLGMSLLPVRFGVPPEIPLITLVRA